ncbi:hypothetical protein TGAM01_v202758 [Trichoderma gamsii]|uniref:Uncharacterized protein n=1 Tax=Trichoderma gamsii TaxID=398673 RepID=A0A2P4ZVF1_9HYPO|nr:hypothetical protein TGAM01_v202758 [Trichoderma gamsii]PON28264.1 hypothetical protein TGAM01_v202758 [Trichoderma gamsii]
MRAHRHLAHLQGIKQGGGLENKPQQRWFPCTLPFFVYLTARRLIWRIEVG